MLQSGETKSINFLPKKKGKDVFPEPGETKGGQTVKITPERAGGVWGTQKDGNA